MVRDMEPGVEVQRAVSTDQISEDPPFQRHPSKSIIPEHKDQNLYGGLPGRSRAPTVNSDLNIQVLGAPVVDCD